MKRFSCVAGGDASASNWRHSSSAQGCPGTADNYDNEVERSDTGGPGSLSVKWAASGVTRVTPVPSTWQPNDLVVRWAVKCPMSRKEAAQTLTFLLHVIFCLLYTSPSPRDVEESRMPSSA